MTRLLFKISLVLNEGMLSGRPVTGSIYNQAVKEMVGIGRNGWIFSPDDPQSIFHTMETVMNTSPEYLEIMRLTARKTTERFRPDEIAQYSHPRLTFQDEWAQLELRLWIKLYRCWIVGNVQTRFVDYYLSNFQRPLDPLHRTFQV